MVTSVALDTQRQSVVEIERLRLVDRYGNDVMGVEIRIDAWR
jgi:hypothetical protein